MSWTILGVQFPSERAPITCAMELLFEDFLTVLKVQNVFVSILNKHKLEASTELGSGRARGIIRGRTIFARAPNLPYLIAIIGHELGHFQKLRRNSKHWDLVSSLKNPPTANSLKNYLERLDHNHHGEVEKKQDQAEEEFCDKFSYKLIKLICRRVRNNDNT